MRRGLWRARGTRARGARPRRSAAARLRGYNVRSREERGAHMKVTVLVENATPSSRLVARHGLSLFVEAAGRRLLFDLGPDATFLDNARTLGVDVSSAEMAVLSHGHYDHGGGLRAYLDATVGCAEQPPVYVREGAFATHVSGTHARNHDIGLDPDLARHPRVVEVGERHGLGGGLTLFSVPVGARPHSEPASNAVLLARGGGAVNELTRDSFGHEQSLLVAEAGRHVLLSGCSHAGILNILERAESIVGGPLDAVVAGFHLMNPSGGGREGADSTRAVALALAERPTRYYTFHCTGMEAFGVLRDVLGDRVRYLATGSTAVL